MGPRLKRELIDYTKHHLCAMLARIGGRVKSLDSAHKSLGRREKQGIDSQRRLYESSGMTFKDLHDLSGIQTIYDYPLDYRGPNG